MTLGVRKLIVGGTIGAVFLAANIMIVASWMSDHGVVTFAKSIRHEFLTGTAIAVILALLILLVGSNTRIISRSDRRCPVCDNPVEGRSKYCTECGSRV